MSNAIERELDQLDKELDFTESNEEQTVIMERIRELTRELADEQQWVEEGIHRGWL